MDMDKVREVRARTAASLSACKRVVEQSGGDVEAAIVALQKSGEVKAASLGGRIAAEGRVYTYRHPGDRLAVVVEVNCETDFTSRSHEFGALCEDVSMQVAGMGALYVRSSDVPAGVMESQERIWMAQFGGAPSHGSSGAEVSAALAVAAKFLKGKREKWLKEVCLYQQALLSDPSRTVEQRVLELSARTGEKIEVRRFVRWELAEGVEKKVEDYAAEVARLAGGG